MLSRWRWFAFAACTAGALALLHLAGVETSELVADPAAVGGFGAHVGMVSQLGLMVWGLAGGACLTAAAALRRERRDPGEATFLIATGALMLTLGVDDALLVHEEVIPDTLGVGEPVVFLLVGLLVAAYAVRFHRELLRSDRFLLGLGAGMLALSAAVDVPDAVPGTVEDYFKSLGIVALAAWCIKVSTDAIASRGAMTSSSP